LDSRSPEFTRRDAKFPKIRCISQKINLPKIDDLKKSILDNIREFGLGNYIKEGEKVAITASSRGIKNQDIILKTIISFLNQLGGKPFIIPAMGSHGGGTAEGQLKILKDYGITPERMNCPIISSMDVIKIGESDIGCPIYIDKHVASADKVIIVNKIKSHSKFVGDVESGLSKMCLLGLGKQEGAKEYHRYIDRHSWPEVVKSTRRVILDKVPIVCGVAIIENMKNETAEIHILNPNEFENKEPELLKRYKDLTERLPFNEIDLLIVDEMGKNIFGTGMDTNITGKKPESKIHAQWLFVRDLTKETQGNAQGIGLADFTTKKLVDKIDFSKTYTNALTAYRTDSPKIPIFLHNDRDVLNTVLNLAGVKNPSEFRLLWIKNTLELHKMIISESLFNIVDSTEDLSYIGDVESITFDSEGFLINSKKFWYADND